MKKKYIYLSRTNGISLSCGKFQS